MPEQAKISGKGEIMIRNLLGLLLVIGGIILGLWLGVYIMFIGGIVQLINAVKATPVEAMGIAIGITRIIFAGLVGWVAGGLCIATGVSLMK